MPARRSLILLVLVGLLAPALPAAAATVESDLVLIRPADTIDEDLYAIGNQVEIAGRVVGDVVVAAAGSVRISGTVEGDLIVFSSAVTIDGTVEGSVRAVTRSLRVTGEVGDDVFVLAGDAAVTGAIGRDLLMWAVAGALDGSVGRDVDGQQRRLEINGSILGDVDVAAGRLEVGPDAEIGGDLRYVSERDAVIAAEAVVTGQVIHATPLPPNVRLRGLGLLIMTLLWMAMLAIGLALLWAVPARTVAAGRRLRRHPGQALLAGAGAASVPFVLAVGSFALMGAISPEAALPLLAVLLPVLVATFGLLGLALLSSFAPAALAVGARVVPSRSKHAQLVIGCLLLAPVPMLPWLGRWLWLALVLLGLGSWFLTEAAETAPTAASTVESVR